MKPFSRLGVVCVTGTLLIAAADTYQQRLLAGRHSRPASPAAKRSDGQEARLLAAVKAAPKDPQARWALARFYEQSGRPDLATQQLELLSQTLSPTSPAQIPLASAWLSLRRGDRAEPIYRRLTTLQPKNKSTWQGLALSLYQQQRWYEATRTAWQANQLDPKDAGSRYLLGSSALAYAQQFPNNTHNDELNLARDQFQSLTQTWPNNSEVYDKLGQAELKLGASDAAIQHLHRALELSPQPDVALNLAHAYVSAGNQAAAQQVIETALVRAPNNAALHNQRGQLLQNTDDAQALTEYQTASRLAPDSSHFLETLAAAYLRAGRLPEARAGFQQELRLNPSRTFPHQQLALIETRLGNKAAAAQEARLATQKNTESQSLLHLQTQSAGQPQNVPMHLQLAARYQALGLVDAARDERLVASRLDPKSVPARQGPAPLKTPTPQ